MGEEGQKPPGAAGSRERADSRSDGSPDSEPDASAEAESKASGGPESDAPTKSESNGADKSNGRGKAESPGSHPTAPSLGPNTVIEREPVEERLARHEQSTEDAMGKDKRRPVVGQSYGPSKTRQLTLYGIFLAVVAAILIGGALLVNALDTPVGKQIPQSAPWAQPNAKQHPPKPLQ
ncbi:MAG TPA: hypothetical protein VKG89_08370 [Solirubrobacterales bacterium]|nr:hypothetical protein [Solirubrobacterales bacterium]